MIGMDLLILGIDVAYFHWSFNWHLGKKWVCLFDCGLWQKFKPEELWILLSQVFEDLTYGACQHCPHLWIQNKSLENIYLWLLW